MRISFIAGLATAGLIAGCGSPPKNLSPESVDQAERKRPQDLETRINTAYTGPKIRVAVGEVGELEAARALFDKMQWPKLGPMLTEQIVTGLAQTGRVAILERTQIDKLVGNIQTEKEGDLSGYFDQETTVEVGKFLGAQAVLIGAITEFEPNVSGGNAGFDIGDLGGLKYHRDKAVVGLDIRLVEQETGRVIYAAHAQGEITSNKADGHASYMGVGFGSDAWWRTPLGAATREAANAAIVELVRGLQEMPWEGEVVGSKAPDKVFIGGGAKLNLRKGDRFRVVHRGEAITGPGGETLGFDETEGGWVELTSVQKEMAVARLVDGELPTEGDIVRVERK